MNFTRKLLVATLMSWWTLAVSAAPILEAEADGTAVNNTTATAQAIPGGAFTTPVPPTVFDPPGYPTATVAGRLGSTSGLGDVDFYSFVSSGAGNLYIDIDNTPFTFDTVVSLFNSAGTLIALDDDSFPADPGSSSDFDSFLGVFALPGAGTYYVAVSQFANFPKGGDACTDQIALLRPDGESGGFSLSDCAPGDSSFQFSGVQPIGALPYTMHISLETPGQVPAPGTFALLGFALGALGLARRRKS